MAEPLLIYLSLKPYEEIEAILKKHRDNLGKWIAQTELATEMVRLVHGNQGLENAQRCSRVLFESIFWMLIKKF